MKAGFVGSGALGSQRYANATGQTMSDISRDLLAQQTKTRMGGYQSALDAALKEQGQQTTAASALGNVGAQTETAAQGSLKSMSDLGAIEQAQEQAKINAPMTNATNAAALLRGYTYPTTTTETYKGPATSYGASPLAQIAGLGTLLGSGFNSSSGWGNQLAGLLGGIFGNSKVNNGINDYFTSGAGTGSITTPPPNPPEDTVDIST
jgi:hypothetical protein